MTVIALPFAVHLRDPRIHQRYEDREPSAVSTATTLESWRRAGFVSPAKGDPMAGYVRRRSRGSDDLPPAA